MKDIEYILLQWNPALWPPCFSRPTSRYYVYGHFFQHKQKLSHPVRRPEICSRLVYMTGLTGFHCYDFWIKWMYVHIHAPTLLFTCINFLLVSEHLRNGAHVQLYYLSQPIRIKGLHPLFLLPHNRFSTLSTIYSKAKFVFKKTKAAHAVLTSTPRENTY